MTRQTIPLSKLPGLEIPLDVEKCPYCDAQLYIAEIDEYSKNDDGTICVRARIDCTAEPELEDKSAWEDWIDWHSQMPYVYWLPVEQDVNAWLKRTYAIVDDKAEKEKLAAWNRAVKGIQSET